MYCGSWDIGDYLTFAVRTESVGNIITDADSVPSYRIYEDETGTAIVTGSMAKLDDSNTTGFYSERVELSGGSGFEKGKTYTVYISYAVSSNSRVEIHTFQIGAVSDLCFVDGVRNVDATLELTKLSINNSDGDAVSLDGSLSGLRVNGSDEGIHVTGATYGLCVYSQLEHAIYARSAASSKSALYCYSTGGDAVTFYSTSGSGLSCAGSEIGIEAVGAGSGAIGLKALGSGSGDGAQFVGGVSGGAGIAATTSTTTGYVAHGMKITNSSGYSALQITSTDVGFAVDGGGSKAGVRFTGGATGPGLECVGGTGGMMGIYARAQAGAYAGIVAAGYSTGSGFYAVGGSDGNGILAVGQDQGAGIAAIGGSRGNGASFIGQGSGIGIEVTATLGSAMRVYSNSAYGFEAESGETAAISAFAGGDGSALSLAGSGFGAGITSTGGPLGRGAHFIGGSASGTGLEVTASDGSAVSFSSDSNGYGLFIQSLDPSLEALRAQNTGGGAAATFFSVSDNGMNILGGNYGAHIAALSTSNPSGNHGILIEGLGDGNGVLSDGGASGSGCKLTGGVHGLNCIGDLVGVQFYGANGGAYVAGDDYGLHVSSMFDADSIAIKVTGYTGLQIQALSGHAISAVGATSGAYFASNSAGNPGMLVAGSGAASGVKCVGGASGAGLECVGGVSGAPGISARAVAGNNDGMSCTGYGLGSGLSVTGGTDGSGLKAKGTNAYGVYVESTGSSGIVVTAGGNGSGIAVGGAGSGNAIYLLGGTSGGHGLYSVGRGTNGDGIRAIGETQGYGAAFVSYGTGKTGLICSNNGDGPGAIFSGNSTGSGLLCVGGNSSGNGATFTKGTGGKDIDADELITAAQVNAEIVDALTVDAISELGVAIPSTTPSITTALMLLYMRARNAGAETSAKATIYNDAGTAICHHDVSDNGTTFTKSKLVAGA